MKYIIRLPNYRKRLEVYEDNQMIGYFRTMEELKAKHPDAVFRKSLSPADEGIEAAKQEAADDETIRQHIESTIMNYIANNIDQGSLREELAEAGIHTNATHVEYMGVTSIRLEVEHQNKHFEFTLKVKRVK